MTRSRGGRADGSVTGDDVGMAANVSRWMKYAKARLDAALGQGNEELDRLEAEREVELADKPWLRSDGDAPSFDEARARIEWEAERQQRLADDRSAPGGTTPEGPSELDDASDEAPSTVGAEDASDAAARESARIELEQRQQLSAARLDKIRQELGIEPSGGDEANG